MVRKNAVNRELKSIPGGVCAPAGFKANGVFCGIKEKETEKDFGLIYSERKCPTAAVFSTSVIQGAPIMVSKERVKDGYAQAIVFNSGNANVFQENGAKVAKQTISLVAKQIKIEDNDVLIASTGKIGNVLLVAPFQNAVKNLVEGLQESDEHSQKAKDVLNAGERFAKQLSFSFELGDYTCKIGAIFKGGMHVSPNMATFLCFITTDVNISSEMLQRALSAEAKESFNLLDIDGVSSPNDMVCIMANGRAGNAKIDCVDSEYKKFCGVLHETAVKICKELTLSDGNVKPFVCEVIGVKSKQVSRAIAKRIVGLDALKSAFSMFEIDVDALLYAIVDGGTEIEMDRLTIALCSQNGKLVVFEGGKKLLLSEERVVEILQADKITLSLNFESGNYSSKAFGCFYK